MCTTEECPYAHVKVDPNAPVCQEFVSGHCLRGVSCTKKHLTPRMIRQLRQSKALQASRLFEWLSTDSRAKGGCQLRLSSPDPASCFVLVQVLRQGTAVQLACCTPFHLINSTMLSNLSCLATGHFCALLQWTCQGLWCLHTSCYSVHSSSVQADSCTSQQSKATVAQAHAAEAGQSVLQDEDLDLRPAFLR